MRWLPLVVAVACSSRAPRVPPKPPPEAPREVFSAYYLGGLRVEAAPPIDPMIAKAFDDGARIGPARLFDVAGLGPQGTWLLVGGGGDCWQLIQMSMGWQTYPMCRSHDVTWAAGGEAFRLAYTTENDDEDGQLFVRLSLAPSGQPTLPAAVSGQATLPRGRIGGALLDRPRARVFFGFTRRESEAPGELWLTTAAKSATTTTTSTVTGDGPWTPLDVSADGRFVVARRDVSVRDAALYLIEVTTGAAVALTEPGTASGAARFTREGDLVAVVEEGDRRQLFRFTGRARIPLSADVPGDVEELAFADDAILFTAVEDGLSTLWRVDDGRARLIPSAPDGGVIGDLRAAGPTVAFSFGAPVKPKHVEIYALDGDKLRSQGRWPNDPFPLARPTQLHQITAADGVPFQVLATLPDTDRKAPVVIEFHGGPEDRWLPKYDAFAQFLVAQGYAVVRPNVRGSTGQGRAFEGLDNGTHREDVVRDIAATLDWIATQPQLDARRVAVVGTSYGGYVALTAVRTFPERVRGAATLGAITDFVGFLEGTAAYRRDHRRAEYGDEREPGTRDYLTKISPLAHVAEIQRPLLMAYGQKDPRVPPAGAERFVRAARAAGVRVWSLAAADEGHWFEHADNRRAFEILVVQFLRSLDQ